MYRPPYRNMEERLLYNSVYDPATGCRVWIGRVDDSGYGRVSLRDGRSHPNSVKAHRVAYEVFKGELIPEGMTVDHICVNRLCIEPSHLRLMEHGENSSDAHKRRNGHA